MKIIFTGLMMVIAAGAFAADHVGEMTDAQYDKLKIKCKQGRDTPLSPAVIVRCSVINHEDRLEALDSGNYEARMHDVEAAEHAQEDRITALESASSSSDNGMEALFPDKILAAYDRDTGDYIGPVLRPYVGSDAYIVGETINGEMAYILDGAGARAFYHMDSTCLDFADGTASYPFTTSSSFPDATFIVKHHGDRDGDLFVYKLDRSVDPIKVPVAYHFQSGICQEGYNPRGYDYDFYPIIYDAPYEIKSTTYRYVSELPQ